MMMLSLNEKERTKGRREGWREGRKEGRKDGRKEDIAMFQSISCSTNFFL
jgi:flagellar biosynthesis/type III secretory pathway protein FliH